MTTDTRHLDTAIAILGGGKARTRKPRETVINLYDYGTTGVSVQVNNREVWLAPDLPAAMEDAMHRQAAMLARGRKARIVAY